MSTGSVPSTVKSNWARQWPATPLGTASEKIKAMEGAGILMAASPAELGTTLQAAVKRGPPKR